MDTVPMTPRCPKCGAPLPANAPQGLCAKCLLLAASTPTEAGPPPSSRPAPPALEAVAAAFPQLEIIELIGQGGMGVVYKARQPKLERFVALKLLLQRPGADPAFAERFNREARVLARLNHPSIVTVFDFGQANGFFYLLMEYVDGVNLRQAMQAGRFKPAQALALVPKICEALQYAHDEGILHRDVKPENILLDTRGRVKIADFGIAKLLGEPGQETKLTESGSAVGTPHYMAPEQIENPEEVDQRADVYSLGVVFYEMLTGELPIGRFAPPSEKSTVDARVDQVVLQALEKEREKRFQNVREVQTRVETIVSSPLAAGMGAPVASPSVRLSPTLKTIIFVALLIAAVGLAINLFPLAGRMPVSLIEFAVSSVPGALGAALAAASFGWLMWLTWQCRNRVLAPLGVGSLPGGAPPDASPEARLDHHLHRLASFTLICLAASVGAQVVIFVVSALRWFFDKGWVAQLALAIVVLVLFVSQATWRPSVARFFHWLLNLGHVGEPAAAEPGGASGVPPIIPPPIIGTLSAHQGLKLAVWARVILLVVALPTFIVISNLTWHRPARAGGSVHKTRPKAAPDGILRAVPVPEENRAAGQTVFRWECRVPTSHALVFRLVQWSSNGVPTLLDGLSSYVLAPASKPAEATFQWSLQDAVRPPPEARPAAYDELVGQLATLKKQEQEHLAKYTEAHPALRALREQISVLQARKTALEDQVRCDHLVASGGARVDAPPGWLPKAPGGWNWTMSWEGQESRVRPGETVRLRLLARRGDGVAAADESAIEVQATLEPVPSGRAAAKSAAINLGTNWLAALKPPVLQTAEAPEPAREHR
jgi:tRNA A-37 threonylcarbamoyl transferase component Bud32